MQSHLGNQPPTNRHLNGLILFLLAYLGTGCSQGPPGQGGDASVRSVVAANQAFAWDLYQHLKTTNENLFFSPYSISSSLALTRAGASNRTALELDQVLHFGSNDMQAAFGKLDHQLRATGSSKVELLLANGLWLQKGHPLLPAFLDTARQNYGAAVKEFDFRTEAEAARTDLNNWIRQQTKNRIDAMAPPGMLDGNTRLVIANAIYFKGTWRTKFDKNATRAATFYVTTDQAVTCPMMFGHGKFKYSREHDREIIELPYAGREFSMIAILPPEADWQELAPTEHELSATNLDALLASLQETELSVLFPKLRLSHDSDLGKALATMGMSDAFNDHADFSGLDGAKFLYISAVRHRAVLDVNEAGTTAAAATVVHTRTKGMNPSFRANRPFIFLIRENRSGSILFLGRVMDPTK